MSIAGPAGTNLNEDLVRVGDFNISTVGIINHLGDYYPIPFGGVIAELNIYEDIEHNAITGTAHIVDSYNMIANEELHGNERLVFKLSTPGRPGHIQDSVDASLETGYPFHIFAIKNRKQISETTVTYQLQFCSHDMMRNTRIRVNRAFTGNLGEMAADILKDPDGLNTKKPIFFEPTKNSDTVVIPNLRPFDALNLLSTKAISGNAKGVGYFFYETAKGFHFRSYESMLGYLSTESREPVRKFKYFPNALAGDLSSRRYGVHTHAVESYSFSRNFNTLSNQATGTYANQVITYNIYDKAYSVSNYNYHREYGQMLHTDRITQDRRTFHNFPMPDSPVDHDPKEQLNSGDKTASDYPESLVVLQPSTRFLHGGDTGSFGTDTNNEGLTEGIRISQRNQIKNSATLKLVVSGTSELQAGEVIEFDYPRMEPNKGGTSEYAFDPKYSGRYLIKRLRHRLIRGNYRMVLECIKDGVQQSFSSMKNENYPIDPPQNRKVTNLYTSEEVMKEVEDELGSV